MRKATKLTKLREKWHRINKCFDVLIEERNRAQDLVIKVDRQIDKMLADQTDLVDQIAAIEEAGE